MSGLLERHISDYGESGNLTRSESSYWPNARRTFRLFDRTPLSELQNRDELLDTVTQARRAGKLDMVGISARQVLDLAVNSGRSLIDERGRWAEWPEDMAKLVGLHRLGRARMSTDEGYSFKQNCQPWVYTVDELQRKGSLWEAGIVIRDNDGQVTTLGVSVPHANDALHAWVWNLTAAPAIVHRKIVDQLMRDVVQRDPEEYRRAIGFEATASDAWLASLGMLASENLVPGEFNEVRRRTGGVFGERLMATLQGECGARKLHERIAKANNIQGYVMKVEKGDNGPEIVTMPVGNNMLEYKITEPRVLQSKPLYWREQYGQYRLEDRQRGGEGDLEVVIGTGLRFNEQGKPVENLAGITGITTTEYADRAGYLGYGIRRTVGDRYAAKDEGDFEGVEIRRTKPVGSGVYGQRPLTGWDVEAMQRCVEQAARMGEKVETLRGSWKSGDSIRPLTDQALEMLAQVDINSIKGDEGVNPRLTIHGFRSPQKSMFGLGGIDDTAAKIKADILFKDLEERRRMSHTG